MRASQRGLPPPVGVAFKAQSSRTVLTRQSGGFVFHRAGLRPESRRAERLLSEEVIELQRIPVLGHFHPAFFSPQGGDVPPLFPSTSSRSSRSFLLQILPMSSYITEAVFNYTKHINTRLWRDDKPLHLLLS